MKLKNLLNLMVLGIALTITSSGCKKNAYTTPIPGTRIAPGGPGGMIGAGPRGGRPTEPIISTDQIPLADTGPWAGATERPEILKSQTIYFDYDKSAIRSGEQSKLDEVAAYLKSNPTHGVRVEGNCDSRGTEEYNRSLGERRALAGREYLITRHGIDPNHILNKSWGEDNPANSPGESEDAYAKNRRDEFIVLIKQ